MDPKQPNQPLSIDYLNKIAPTAPKSKLPFKRNQMILLGVLGAAVIIVIILAIALGGLGGTKKYEKQLAARLIGTATIASDGSSKLKGTSLRALNGNLNIYLADVNQDIIAPLSKDDIDATKLDKGLLADESGSDITTRLEDARLNGVYDRTYAREMAYRLATILTLMNKILGSTSNKDLKTFLTDAVTNLEPTQQQFADFNETTG